MSQLIERTVNWFLHSGIQDSSGGVARYYRTDTEKNAPVSNEITGYAVSSLLYLNSLRPDPEAQKRAARAARYLADKAWDASSSTLPFEPASERAYFFDLGIAARGLMAAWKATAREEYRDTARSAALSMAFDFLGEGFFNPIITLPEKHPLPPEPKWSHRPGCYQLKAALAWREAADQPAGSRMFDHLLAYALATHDSFLQLETDRARLMDRLHAYLYFLEALLFVADREECQRVLESGVTRVASLHSEIADEFERSDVVAQLLRVRLIAHHACGAPLDQAAARSEAASIASYHAASEDSRIDGGFWFGRKGGTLLPFMNPVSTAFCVQALALWRQHESGEWRFELTDLI